MESQFIAYKNSTIHYCVYGNGLKLLFCFHGYGEKAENFSLLEPMLGESYTLIAIDMPFHGQTDWKEGLDFTAEELVAIMKSIAVRVMQGKFDTGSKINTETFTIWPTEGPGFTLLGYSMGGRIALQLLQNIPSAIDRVVLVAPDGLHKIFWYMFATQTYIGNKVFKYLMHQPHGALHILSIAEKYKLVHAGLLKIVRYYTDAPEERKKLYCRWTAMRKFRPKLRLVKQVIKQQNIPVRFLFGRFDNIILSKRADIFKNENADAQIHIIDAGHRLLQEKYIPAISALFYQ